MSKKTNKNRLKYYHSLVLLAQKTNLNNSSSISVEKLVSQIYEGNQKAFEKLYDMYSPALFGIICKILQNENAAEDVLQITMVKIWKKINSFDQNKGSIFTWMLNIARNAAIDELRKIKRLNGGEIQSISLDVNIGNNSGSEGVQVQEIGVKNLLDKLPVEQKQVLEYLYFKGFTQQETSDELGLPLGTVKSRSRIALRDLKKFFNSFLFWI